MLYDSKIIFRVARPFLAHYGISARIHVVVG